MRLSEGKLVNADKRNTSVVFALIVSMTFGVVVLLWLENWLVPEKQDFSGSTLLMANQGLRVASVEVSYVPPPANEEAVAAVRAGFRSNDTICWVPAEGDTAPLEARGPHVRLVVLGSAADVTLDDNQKMTLLAALGTLSQLNGDEAVPVRLAATSDWRSPQADDLRRFLERKGFIADN